MTFSGLTPDRFERPPVTLGTLELPSGEVAFVAPSFPLRIETLGKCHGLVWSPIARRG
jgi:hypothetical protein